MKKPVTWVLLGLSALALAGCGGSSGTLNSRSSSGSGTGSGGGSTGTTATYSMGSGSGSSFQPGVIDIASKSLSAGGTTSLTVSIVDQTGALYTAAPVTITFSSTCISQGLASVTATGGTSAGPSADSVITSTGTATASYTATGCSGSDVITASATVGSATLTATGTLTVAAASTGSIEFMSATPSTIGLKGTGQPQTSTVVFKVLDSSGAPKPGVTVNFSLNTTVGGLSLSPLSATSAADGTVQTVVSSGTVHTPVTVTASISSPALTTQSSVLTVTTGIPADKTFTIAVGPAQYASGGISNAPACPNVEAWGIAGVNVPITVSLADRYDNPVLDGTAVSFYTDGGKISGSCTTAGGTGPCAAWPAADSVAWTSENPEPTPELPEPWTSSEPGRVQILATAVGEESFDDVAGTGFYQAGDTFDDLGEPYDDSQELGHYVTGDYFLDYNRNGKWDGPSGSFVGITCTGTSPGSTCTSNTLALGAEHLIIMSTGVAHVTIASASGQFTGFTPTSLSTAGASGTGSASVTFNFTSDYGPDFASYSPQQEYVNPIGAGSTIAVSADNTVGLVGSTSSSFTTGCSSAVAGQDYTVLLSGVSATSSGYITVDVTSPGTKTITQVSFPVN
jgi:hypothetical protein